MVFVAHTFVKDVSPYILTFHMPLFFIVSGYFYKQRPFLDQLKIDVRRLLVPFFFIVILTYFLKVLHNIYVGHSVMHPDSPAWFLLSLFGAKLLYNLIGLIFPRYKILMSFILSSIPCFIFYWYDIPRNVLIASSCICAVIFIAIGNCVRCLNILSYLDKHKFISIFIAFLLWLNSSVFGEVDLHLCHFKLWFIDYAGACGGTYLCYSISSFFANHSSKITILLSKLGYYSLIVYSFHAIEYVFPSWYQLCSISNSCPLVYIVLIRLSLCCLVSLAAYKTKVLRKIFYP